MMLSVQQSSAWREANRRFSLTRCNDPFGDLDPGRIHTMLDSDPLLAAVPPLCIVSDVMQVIQHFRAVRIEPISPGGYEELLHAYRNRVLFALLERDGSIEQAHRILLTKGRRERRFFVPFVIRLTARNLVAGYGMETAGQTRATDSHDRLVARLAKQLQRWVRQWRDTQPLFSQEDIDLLSYVRREEDVPIIKEYSKARRLLRPVDPVIAKRTRAAHAHLVEVDNVRSPSMGGIAGITAGGDIEKITSIVPSELAMMEPGSSLDLFDVNLLENRLLSFVRDHNVDVRRNRSFHIVFLSPESLESMPAVIPFRWQYFFIAVVFDIISYYRHYFGLKRFPFYFVFPEHSDQATDVFDLIAMVHARDCPDVVVETHALPETRINEYTRTRTAVDRNDESVVCLARRGEAMLAEFAALGEFTSGTYGVTGKPRSGQAPILQRKINDVVELCMHRRHRTDRQVLEIGDRNETREIVNRARDLLFMAISDVFPQTPSSVRAAEYEQDE